MKNRIYRLTILLIGIVLLSTLTFSDEGMWMLNQLDKLPWQEMQKYGLQLSPEQIYNPAGTSLKDAIVLLGGGTGSFISPNGLILTNHHVAFGAIQTLSTVEKDYLKDGFIAKTKEEELSVPNYIAQVIVSQKDVTDEVLSAVNDTMNAEERSKAIQSKISEIQKKEKGDTDYECRIAEFYNGVKYFLFVYDVIRDVRLVYAPPTSIGNYGGEVDNWYWPRHTGDFALMRAYVASDGKQVKYAKENVPFEPKSFLPISIKGYDEGTFAMIMGFPGQTFRYRTTPEIQFAKDETLPLSIELFKTRMDILESAWKNDRATEIKYIGRWRGMANVYKNRLGTLDGMRRADILKVRKEEEKRFMDFIKSKLELETKYGTVLSDIASEYNNLKTFSRKQVVMNQLMMSSDILTIANRFRNFANSFVKDSLGKLKPPQASVDELFAYGGFIQNAFKNVNLAVDKELLTTMILKAAELPEDQKVEFVQKIIGNKTGEKRVKAIKEFVEDLYDDSKLTTVEGCMKFINKDADDILDDEFVEFAVELDKDNSQVQQKMTVFNSKIGLLRSKLLEAIMEWKGKDIYPDANRTLRLTYGQVKSYYPRDAVHYDYQTTLSGIMEKETGEDPFIVPNKLRELWENKDFGSYVDPRLKDVPVAFIANLDITGGNSGSPVINGNGELIGLAFDANWEAVVGDYIYQEPLNRSINVDARYILFILDKFSNAQNILNELVIR